MIIEKKCSCCGETKPVSGFYKHETGKDGYRNHCKTCCLLKQKKANSAKKKAIEDQKIIDSFNKTPTKLCRICKVDKPLDAFKPKPSNVTGYESVCVSCKEGMIAEHRSACSVGKKCGHCGDVLPLGMFHKKKSTLSGYSSWCKSCSSLLKKESWQKTKHNQAAKRKEYRDANKHRHKLLSKEHYEANKERYATLAKEYREKNLLRMRESNRRYYLANTARHRAATAFRNAWKLNATPTWLSKGHRREIGDFYVASKMFRVYTGEDYHVDHIVPLVSDIVCGLHVPWNLQILSWRENISKGNRYWPDMPEQE